jgi:polyhydroxyalkanoate synthesis regulator phasin
MAGSAQFKIGYIYEQMVKAGMISEEQAKPLICESYQAAVAKYPDCQASKTAQQRLEQFTVKTEVIISDTNDVNDVNGI